MIIYIYIIVQRTAFHLQFTDYIITSQFLCVVLLPCHYIDVLKALCTTFVIRFLIEPKQVVSSPQLSEENKRNRKLQKLQKK